MFLEGYRFLSSARFKMIIQTLSSKLDVTAPMIFLGRVPMVNAYDDEIVGRFTGRIFAADVIGDGQKSSVYESGKLELVTNQIPNLKVGQNLTQEMLNRLARMKAGALLPGDNDAMEMFQQRMGENLVTGVRQRINQLICAMLLDSLDYDRLGIKITGATWGTPANLKVTPAQAWSTDGIAVNANATPIADLLTMANEVAADNYGIRYDRATMSSKAFRFAVATDEFKAKAQVIFGFQIGSTYNPMNVHDLPTMQRMLGTLLNMEVEVYDAAYWQRTPAGADVRTRVLPANKVILTQKQDDGDGSVWDFANGQVTESMVASLIGGMAPDGTGQEYGPIGYYTPGAADLNPPSVTAWACARGWPRKHVPESSGVLTVGTWAA